jgi:hypothetical protein
VRAGENKPTLNRSAIVVTPKQPFLDWLHTTDAMSAELTLLELIRDPTIHPAYPLSTLRWFPRGSSARLEAKWFATPFL